MPCTHSWQPDSRAHSRGNLEGDSSAGDRREGWSVVARTRRSVAATKPLAEAPIQPASTRGKRKAPSPGSGARWHNESEVRKRTGTRQQFQQGMMSKHGRR